MELHLVAYPATVGYSETKEHLGKVCIPYGLHILQSLYGIVYKKYNLETILIRAPKCHRTKTWLQFQTPHFLYNNPMGTLHAIMINCYRIWHSVSKRFATKAIGSKGCTADELHEF